MRKYYLLWGMLVLGIIGTAYGTHLLIHNFSIGKGLNIAALFILIAGALLLLLFIVLAIITAFTRKKHKQKEEKLVKDNIVIEEPKEEKIEPAPIKIEEPKKVESVKKREYAPREKESRSSYSYYASSTIYVKKVGYGPILRFDGNRILDMRDNTYYRIEDNVVMQEGYGIRFEIRGNQIRDAFGGYQYEISGSNINKVFGGFFASISDNYISTYNLSDKYEMTDSLSKKQLLVFAILVFGRY